MSRPMPTPDTDAGAPAAGGPPPGAAPPPAGSPGPAGPTSGLQAPADGESQAIASMYKICERLQMSNPVIAPSMRKACEALQEAQTAKLMNRPPTNPPEQNPPV